MFGGDRFGANVSRRRKKSTFNDEEFVDGHSSDSEASENSLVPVKRGRTQKKPLRNVNSYDSIQVEVTKEKQRKTPARKPRGVMRGRRRNEEEDEMDELEASMSERMVDRIAALNDGKRTKVLISNCFDSRTALDCIDVCLRESENMQEDAVALALATTIYSLRVDRTHNDAQETRYTFIRGKSDAEKAMMLAADSNQENSREKKKRKKAEKDAEAQKANDANEEVEQPLWMRAIEPDTFDYTFGLKFPVQGSFSEHWEFSEDLLDHIESRRVDARKAKKRKKLMAWKKIITLDYCPFYTGFEDATAKVESDRFDSLATFRLRKGSSGTAIMLHDASTRKATPAKVIKDVDISVVKQNRDILANCLSEQPTTWEHYLLEDNPQFYRTGQYLRTGDMTGYVFQERPFYHQFDPDQESADDPGESYSFIEKNADRTLYTFKKPPKGTTLPRLAPLIRVPLNKYANPRNRRASDFYLKENIEIVQEDHDDDLENLEHELEDTWAKMGSQDMEEESSSARRSMNLSADQGFEELNASVYHGESLLDHLLAKHREHAQDLESLRDELRKQARSSCSDAAIECVEWSNALNRAADEALIEDHEVVDWKTTRFLESVGFLKQKSFPEILQERFVEQSDPGITRGQNNELAEFWGTGQNAVELRVKDNILYKKILHLLKRGFHKDLHYLDATYHMEIFKFKVSVEQAHESLRKAERLGVGKSPEEVAILKQKCFRPGRYQGIRDGGRVSVCEPYEDVDGLAMNLFKKSYQLDPWSSEKSTTTYSDLYFQCRDYPRLEGALLQLRNDIREAVKKISLDSWYYSTSDEPSSSHERRNWMERVDEAVSYFSVRLNREEEAELRQSRALPKLIQRAVMPRVSTDAATPNLESVPDTPAADTPAHENHNEDEEIVNEEEQEHVAEVPSVNGEDFADDIGCPENDDDAGFEDEKAPTTDAVAGDNQTHNNSEEPESLKGKSKLEPEHVEEPPKKKEKRVKLELDVKIEETELEYFTKMPQHHSVSLKERFKIVDSRTLVRSEDVIFTRRKPFARRPINQYKFEDFIKPGLLRKGRYPNLYFEPGDLDSRADNVFTGILRKATAADFKRKNDTETSDTELDIYDEWLATFGGFRVFLDEENGNDDDRAPNEQDSATRRSYNENESTMYQDGNQFGLDDSTASFFSSVNTTRRDRFNDIRPDEYKAIGIDVKNIVPNKDFYSMTKEEQAAAVAAEFEAIDALGPKREEGYVISIMDFSCRVHSYHINTARMKRVMKSILSNPLLAYDKVLYTRRALLARRRLEERHKLDDSVSLDPAEIYYKKLDRSLDSSLGPVAEKILEENNPMDITALDPIDVLDAVTYRNLEGMIDAEELSSSRKDSTNKGVEESMRQFAAEVRQSDFRVQGLHTFSSVMQCLPRRMGASGKYINIANALAVTLYMCNENTLTLVQERAQSADLNKSVNEGEPWMGNFIITNASDAALFEEELHSGEASFDMEASSINAHAVSA